MTEFAQFVAPEASEGDRFIPKDNVGHVVVIKPITHEKGIITSNSPEGTDAIKSDVIDLDAPGEPAVYRDTLLFGGAFTDAFRNYLGKVVVVKIESRKSKSGRNYAVPVPVDEAQQQRAKDLFAKGDPFAPAVTTTQPATAKPPF